MRRKFLGSLSFLMFFIFCLLACEKFQGKNTGSQGVDGSLVIAKIGNVRITVKEFQRKYSSIPPQYKMLFTGEDGKKKFLDEIIKEKVLAEKARNIGIDKKEEIKEVIEDIKSNILAKEMFAMKNEEIAKSAAVTDEEVEKEIKTSSTIASASHILIKDENKAKDVLKKIVKGEDFKKLAQEFSEDPSVKNNNGDLGTFSKGDMVPEFDKAIFTLKIGDVNSELVKTDFGYHIIKRTEPAKEEVKNRLIAKKQTDSLNSWMDEIKKEVSVEISEDILKKIKVEEEPGQIPGMPQGHGAGGGKGKPMPAGHGGM